MTGRSISFMGGRECEGADVVVGHGVTVELAREENGSWGVWGVHIDGKLYREPRDLTAEPLNDGPFLHWVRAEFEAYERNREET